jgi:phosphoribosylformylglycinamidine cyclo-ligase
MAGFAVGIVDNSKIIDGTEVRVGHRLIGIASSGLHSNGYSLVRKICFDRLKLKIDDYVPDLGQTIGEALLTPTKIYVDPLLSIMKDLPVHGLAHITGGGIEDNILRIVPQACHISIQGEIWDVPPIFSFLKQAGNVSDAEMRRTFNNGIGMIAVVPAEATDDVLQRLDAINEKAYLTGEIMECKDSSQRITWE